MNDREIDKMFDNINVSLPSSLEGRMLASSCKALKKSYFFRKAIKRTVSIAAMFLISAFAFLAGQAHEGRKVSQLSTPSNEEDMITMIVHKDFIAWVDAGYFFAHIEMQDKANEAFDNAISLIPKEQLNTVKLNQADVDTLVTNNESQVWPAIAMVNSISK